MNEFLLFFKQHWKRILLRAHKDRRSLVALLFLLGIIAYFAFYGVFLLNNPIAAVILALGSIVTWVIRKAHKKEDAAVFKISNYIPVNTTPSDEAVVALRRKTVQLWMLLWRASSEAFLKEKSLPESIEVKTRKTILDKLNELDLRDTLCSQEIDLHLLPDGHWASDSIAMITFRKAELEALQFACGAISSLSPIEDFDRVRQLDIEPLRSLTDAIPWKPKETYDIRHEVAITSSFYIRCLAEQERRGIAERCCDEDVRKAIEEVDVDAGSHDRDLLIGTEIISHVPNGKLNLAAAQAWLRLDALTRALALLEG